MVLKRIVLIISLPIFSMGIFGCNVKPKEKRIENNQYILIQDISYGDDYRQRYDIVLPKTKIIEHGLFLGIHGGAWVSGDKKVYRDQIIDYATKYGMVTAALDYRYANYKNIHYEEILSDIASCIASIDAVSRKNGFVLNKMITSGASAGGHLSLLYSYSHQKTSIIRPVAAISYCGPTDLNDPSFYNQKDEKFRKQIREVIEKVSGTNIEDGISEEEKSVLNGASPVKYVTSDTVPTLFGHGTIDDTVPYSNALSLKDLLDQNSIKNDFITFNNSGHGLDNDQTASELMDEKIAEYFELLK